MIAGLIVQLVAVGPQIGVLVFQQIIIYSTISSLSNKLTEVSLSINYSNPR